MSRDARASILRRRAAFVSAALAAAGCAPPPSAPEAAGHGAEPPPPGRHEDRAAHPSAPPGEPSAAADAAPRAPFRSPRVIVSVCLSIASPPRVAFGEGDVEPDDGAVLRETSAMLRDHPRIARVAVEGHRDPTEPAGLSRARAARVEELLVAEGTDPDRLCLVDLGDTQPIADATTAEGRARNRRVSFRILEDPEPCDDPGLTR